MLKENCRIKLKSNENNVRDTQANWANFPERDIEKNHFIYGIEC